MKYTEQYVVVPYIPQIENQSEKQVTSLDEKMKSILHDNSLPADIKVRLYNKAVSDYSKTLNNYNLTASLQTKSNLAEQGSRIVDEMVNKFQPQLDKIEKQTLAPVSASLSATAESPLATPSNVTSAKKSSPINRTPSSVNKKLFLEADNEDEVDDDVFDDAQTINSPLEINSDYKLIDVDGYLVPEFFKTQQSKQRMTELKGITNKLDNKKVKEYMKTKGKERILNKINKLKNPNNQQISTAINNEIIEIYKDFKSKGIEGSGLKKIQKIREHKKHSSSGGHQNHNIKKSSNHSKWEFKNFF